MSQLPAQAMILAAGFGTRLRPLTHYVPKPALPIANSPILHYTLHHFEKAGIQDVIINLHHLADRVKEMVLDYRGRLNIYFSYEEVILGTGGAIKRISDQIDKNKPILIFNGDILFCPDISKIMEFHLQKQALVTMVLRYDEQAALFGEIGLNEYGRVISFPSSIGTFPQKPNIRGMFTGVHILDPEIFNFFPKQDEFCIVRELYVPLVQKQAPIYGFFDGHYWNDIGTPQRYYDVNFDVIAQKRNIMRFVNDDAIFDISKSILIDSSSIVERDVLLDEQVIIGPDCIIEQGCYCKHVIVLAGCHLKMKEQIRNCIVHPRCIIPL